MSRKLDAALAEALGYEIRGVEEQQCGYIVLVDVIFKNNVNYGYFPRYSTDPAAMLELDREMRERGYSCSVVRYMPKELMFDSPHIRAQYYKPGKMKGIGLWVDTEPLARALAAYKALKGKNFDLEEVA